MTTGAMGGARLSAALGPCTHADYEPVALITGEVVAQVCTNCLYALPAEWVEARQLGSARPDYLLGGACDRHSRNLL